MEEYYDADEWGQIIHEETTKNMDMRMAPARRLGIYYIFMAIVDFILAVVIYTLSMGDAVLKDLPPLITQVLFIAFLLSGIACMVIGAFKLGKKARKTVILEKGIVRGTFRHFKNTPMIEVRGPKDKVMVLIRSGSGAIHTDLRTVKRQRSHAFVLEAPQEYDWDGYIAALKKFGYGEEGEKVEKKEDRDGQGDGSEE